MVKTICAPEPTTQPSGRRKYKSILTFGRPTANRWVDGVGIYYIRVVREFRNRGHLKCTFRESRVRAISPSEGVVNPFRFAIVPTATTERLRFY